MLRFEVDVTAADAESRVIEGTAVPYGETATLGDREYEFTQGSLRPARARTPLLLGHDMNRPVGVLLGIDETDAGAIARFRVDPGPEGDTALAQAQSGSRSGLSIGASIVEASDREDGVRVVSQASLAEVSLVSVAAFASAEVTSVTAAAEAAETDPTDMPEEATVDPMQEQEAVEPVAAAIEQIMVKAEAPRRELTATEYVKLSHHAMRGDVKAQEQIRAALTVVETGDVPGLLPDAMTSAIIGGIKPVRSIASVVRNAPLPATGLKLVQPQWGSVPQISTIGFDDPAPSGAVTITNHEVDLVQWAWAGAASVSIIERGAPDYVESVFGKVADSYFAHVEDAIADLLAATVVTTTNTAVSPGKCIAEVYNLTQRPADTLLVAPDVYGDWLDAEGVLKFATGSLDNGMSGTAYGARVVASPYLAAGTVYALSASQIVLRESNPMRLTATNVGALQIEFGATGFYCLDIEDVNAVVALD